MFIKNRRLRRKIKRKGGYPRVLGRIKTSFDVYGYAMHIFSNYLGVVNSYLIIVTY